MPAFNTALLKFKIRPRRKPIIRKYVSICRNEHGLQMKHALYIHYHFAIDDQVWRVVTHVNPFVDQRNPALTLEAEPVLC